MLYLFCVQNYTIKLIYQNFLDYFRVLAGTFFAVKLIKEIGG